MLGNFPGFCYRLQTFFKINFFTKNYFRNTIRSECQMVWIHIRTDILIWVQTVCKGFFPRGSGATLFCHSQDESILTINEPIVTKFVCLSRLLKCLRRLYGKQCGPRSDCSYRSSLFWVHTVCFYT